MVGSQDEISFEVHVFRWDRWEVHGRYPAGKKDAAVKDARSLERISTINAVRVIRAYDPAEGLRQQSTIYESPALTSRRGRDAARHATASRPQAAADRRPQTARTRRPHGGRKSRSAARAALRVPQRSSNLVVFMKILLITLFSIVLGGLVMGLASVWLSEDWLGSELHTKVLVGIFLASFLLSAIVMALTFLSPEDFGTWSKEARAEARRARHKGAAKSVAHHDTEEEPIPEEADALAEAAAAQLAEALHGDVAESLDPEPEGAPTAAAAMADDEPAPAAQTAEAAEATAETIEATEPSAGEEPQVPEPGQELPEPVPARSPFSYTGEQMATMTTFVDSALGDVDHRNLDTFEKFGLDLFIAGACEALAHERAMANEASAQMLADFVQSLGFTKSQADAFRERYPEYLVEDPRYMQMFMAGRNTLRSHLEGDPDTGTRLQQALVEWNAPKTREAPGLIAVMFTDIAGSTDLTQSQGDDIAQEVVHAHNQIVRDALTAFNGREVKHTGDGIMASFSVTSNSIQAASAIQRRVAAHNRDVPDLPLRLKIGINVGEPISEDDDLFGTTVQIAARIVAEAQADQILVSEIVRGICAGKKFEFVNRGPHALKGFKGDLTLYEVVWDAAALTDEEPAEDEPAQQTSDVDGEASPDEGATAAVSLDVAPETDTGGEPPPEPQSPAEPAEAPSPSDAGMESTAAAEKPAVPPEPAPGSDQPPPTGSDAAPLAAEPASREPAAPSPSPTEPTVNVGIKSLAGVTAAPPRPAAAPERTRVKAGSQNSS